MAETSTVVDTDKKQESNEPDYEALAREIGWAPLDKFRGDPSKHIDAKTYYEKGEFVLPIVKKQRDEAKKEAEKLSRDLAEMKGAMADFQKITEAAAERQVKELQSEVAALKSARAAAVAAGDDKAFREADDAIEERKEAIAKAQEKPKPKNEDVDPQFEAWREENDWYDNDPEKKLKADVIGASLRTKNPNLRGVAFLNAVTEKLEQIEGELSGIERPGPQRGGKASGGNSKAKTFENLKPEYKQGFARMVKNGVKMTEAQYIEKCDPDAWGG